MISTHASDFGALLRDLRVAANLTQEELAARAGMSVRGISDLERGIYRGPRPYTLRRLEDALDLSENQRALLKTAMRSGGERAITVHGRKTGNFLGAEPALRFVARQAELAHIRLALDAVLAGSGRMALLAGAPGVGKTRLAQETACLAETAGAVVVPSRCHEGESGSAFYPFLEALESLHSRLPDSLRAMVPERWPYLTRLLPGGADPDLLVGTSENQQQRIFRAVTGFVQAAAQIRPVALLIDDLHWADSSSLFLLLHLARFTRGNAILLLGTYREGEVPDHSPLDRVRVALLREELADPVALRPFAREETAALMAAMLGGEAQEPFIDQIQETTRGNAYFARELVRTLADRGDLALEDDRWSIRDGVPLGLPETIRAAIRERLSRLDEPQRMVLGQASVLGERFSVVHLAAMSGEMDALEGALESAQALGLVHHRDGMDYRFDHALTREVLYAEMSPFLRQRSHRAAATAFAAESSGKRVAEAAWHWLQGGEWNRALALSIEAGHQAAAVGAMDEAVRHFRTALDLARELHDDERERHALEHLGASLTMAGTPDEALEALGQAAERYRLAGDLEAEARVLVMFCEMRRMLGATPVLIERPMAVLSALEAAPPTATQAQLAITISRVTSFALGRYEESRRLAARGARIAGMAGEPGAQALAEARCGIALLALGRVADARRTLERAIRRAEKAGDFGALSEALRSITAVYEAVGEFELAWTSADRAVAIEERFGHVGGLAWAVMLRGQMAQVKGDWTAAWEDYARSLDLFVKLPGSIYASYAVLTFGELALLTDDREGGLQKVHQALAALRARGHRVGIQRAEAVLAELELFEGRAAEAAHRLEGWLEETDDSEALFVYPLLAEAYIDLGMLDRARATTDAAFEPARERGYRLLAEPLHRVRGMIAAAAGCWDAAQRAFEEALTVGECVPVPFARARTLYEFGLAAATRGDEATARAYFTDAAAIYRRLGARSYVRRVEEALAAMSPAATGPR